MSITIKDVAKAAGVSTATVSRVINNNPLIAPKTAEKVKQTMRELEYFPSSMARGFSNKNTYNIALVVDIENLGAFNNPFFYKIQYGIESIIYQKGYNLIIANKKTNAKDNILNRIIHEKRADGIVLPSLLIKKSILQKMEQNKMPYVVIGEPPRNYDINWIDIDNKRAGYIATTHLLNNGFKRVAFICGDEKDTFNIRRLEGYKEGLLNNGSSEDSFLIFKKVTGKDEGYKITKDLMAGINPPDAFVFSDNIAAFGAMDALKDNGYKIPKDIGIVSFDNFMIAELTKPKMTTVDIDVFQLGVQVGLMLVNEIEAPSECKHNRFLSVKLIERGSAERS